jgi:hypothetical protein
MTPQQAKDKFDNNDVIDALKQFYDEFRDITDPILQKQKLEFDLFYNNDLKYRKICLEIEEQIREQTENLNRTDFEKYKNEVNAILVSVNKIIEERERFNITFHRVNRMKQINTYPNWLMLFIGEKAPIQQSATMFKMASDLLDSQAVSLQSDIRMDNEKLINDLSEEEEKAFNFNMARPFKEHSTKQRKEILKLYKPRFEGIPLDLDLMNTIQNRKPASSKKNKIDTGFNLGYTDTQLTALHKALIDNNFLDSQTKKTHFINAFNGKKLTSNFKQLDWFDYTRGAIFISYFLRKHRNFWSATEHLLVKASYKTLLSQSKGNSTFETVSKELDSVQKQINLLTDINSQ